MASPNAARRGRPGSPKKIVRSARAISTMAMPPTSGTVRLSSSVVGIDSTSAHSSVTGTMTVRIQGESIARAGSSSVHTERKAAARPPNTTKAANPAHPLRGFQGSRAPPTAWPTMEAITSPTAISPHTAATIQRSSRSASRGTNTLSG